MRLSVERIARRALPALSLVLAAACGDDDLDLREAYGTYVLQPMAGSLINPAYTDTLFLESRFASDGAPNVARHKTTSLERRAAAPEGSAPDSAVVHVNEYFFDVSGDEVLIVAPCPPTADCIGGPILRGPLDGDRLTLHPRPEMSSPTRHYLRVGR
jgi:hypothetical protein